MSLKEKIKQLINVINDTNINEIEVSSFWGAQKIKLTKKVTVINKNDLKSKYISDISNKTTEAETIIHKNPEPVQQSEVETELSNKEDETISENDIDEEQLNFQKAPLVGTFYLSPKPGENPFIKVGDNVHKGQVICIIEAMKIFNQIESDFDGVIHEILIDDNSPVEFNQSIISIIPE